MSFTQLPKPIECTPRVNPSVSCGLWVIMTCQYSFIKYTIVVRDVDRGGFLFNKNKKPIFKKERKLVHVVKATSVKVKQNH